MIGQFWNSPKNVPHIFLHWLGSFEIFRPINELLNILALVICTNYTILPNQCNMLVASILHWLDSFEISPNIFHIFWHWLGSFEILQNLCNFDNWLSSFEILHNESWYIFDKTAQSMWNACCKHFTLIRQFWNSPRKFHIFSHWLGSFEIYFWYNTSCRINPINVKCLLQAFHMNWVVLNIDWAVLKLPMKCSILHWLGNFERILQQSVNCPINVECHNLFSKRAKLPKSFNFTQSMWNACAIYMRKHFTLIG